MFLALALGGKYRLPRGVRFLHVRSFTLWAASNQAWCRLLPNVRKRADTTLDRPVAGDGTAVTH